MKESKEQRAGSPLVVSRTTAKAEQWAAGCLAWRLVTEDALAVAEEAMAPGTQEAWHVHDRTTQYFHVLAGELDVRTADGVRSLGPGEGLVVRPGQPHQAAVTASAGATFLVISAPSSSGDRRAVAAPSS
ncbi:cupin domain-containing protein [Amnibacterium sp. CER49]|uniref:cupin domain-containing protein n=1 Tax=Amnibacterium sp. CER49 TaxID=3039161 RepID=UPI00244A6D70|nr:cupin domain-containing protein [Amnibacterium sp. CER49]MDH2443513.1 cupin domain-containing protein [Amnibacterium sp. CER49]